MTLKFLLPPTYAHLSFVRYLWYVCNLTGLESTDCLFSYAFFQLVKSRIQRANRYRRIGFKIRANPHNSATLQQIVVMLAVPPCVDGPSVKMSRRGGVWDEMKRTISWIIDSMEPGTAIEVQAQFEVQRYSRQQDAPGPAFARC